MLSSTFMLIRFHRLKVFFYECKFLFYLEFLVQLIHVHSNHCICLFYLSEYYMKLLNFEAEILHECDLLLL